MNINLKSELDEHLSIFNNSAKILDVVSTISEECISTLKLGKKIITFGNGGSASDSQHFSAEIVGRYKFEKEPLPSISLNTDTSIITSIANDYGFVELFSRQISAYGKEKDISIGISTSGKSKNVLKGLQKAKELGLTTIGFCGNNTSLMNEVCDITLSVPSSVTARIQEFHIFAIHLICDEIDKAFRAK